MSLINVSIQHGRSLDEARAQLEKTVLEATSRFGMLLNRTEWSEDRNFVKLSGPGVVIEMRVDQQAVHVAGDLPFLGGLLGSKLSSGLKGILQKTFPKRLTNESKP